MKRGKGIGPCKLIQICFVDDSVIFCATKILVGNTRFSPSEHLDRLSGVRVLFLALRRVQHHSKTSQTLSISRISYFKTANGRHRTVVTCNPFCHSHACRSSKFFGACFRPSRSAIGICGSLAPPVRTARYQRSPSHALSSCHGLSKLLNTKNCVLWTAGGTTPNAQGDAFNNIDVGMFRIHDLLLSFSMFMVCVSRT